MEGAQCIDPFWEEGTFRYAIMPAIIHRYTFYIIALGPTCERIFLYIEDVHSSFGVSSDCQGIQPQACHHYLRSRAKPLGPENTKTKNKLFLGFSSRVRGRSQAPSKKFFTSENTVCDCCWRTYKVQTMVDGPLENFINTFPHPRKYHDLPDSRPPRCLH